MIIFIIFFFIFGIGNLVGEFMHNSKIIYVTKPLLMPFLGLYYIVGNPGFNLWILLAIIGSFVGDVLLMIIEQDPKKSDNFFALGLVSFLLAQIFFIIGFVQLANKFDSFLWWGIFIMILFAAYTVFWAKLLLPSLEKKDPDMKVPVLVYIIIIGAMSVSSVFPLGALSNSFYLIIGAVLFVISDSVLSINKFKKEIPYERLIVMSTYILAQFFIIQGVLLG